MNGINTKYWQIGTQSPSVPLGGSNQLSAWLTENIRRSRSGESAVPTCWMLHAQKCAYALRLINTLVCQNQSRSRVWCRRLREILLLGALHHNRTHWTLSCARSESRLLSDSAELGLGRRVVSGSACAARKFIRSLRALNLISTLRRLHHSYTCVSVDGGALLRQTSATQLTAGLANLAIGYCTGRFRGFLDRKLEVTVEMPLTLYILGLLSQEMSNMKRHTPRRPTRPPTNEDGADFITDSLRRTST